MPTITPPTWSFLGDVATEHGLGLARFFRDGIACGLFEDCGYCDLSVEVRESTLVFYFDDSGPRALAADFTSAKVTPPARHQTRAPQTSPPGGWDWQERYR